MITTTYSKGLKMWKAEVQARNSSAVHSALGATKQQATHSVVKLYNGVR